MMSIGLILFCLMYIGLMSIIKVDGLSFWAIILALVISYYLTPITTSWIMENKKRSRDDWFSIFFERK